MDDNTVVGTKDSVDEDPDAAPVNDAERYKTAVSILNKTDDDPEQDDPEQEMSTHSKDD